MGERGSRQALSGREILASGAVAAVLVSGAYAWTSAGTPPASPNAFIIAMTDYAFAPNRMVWRVGDRVTITLLEESQAVPPKPHEFMIGRTPLTEETVFGTRERDGFEARFFDGVTIEIVAGSGLSMLMAGGAALTGLPPGAVLSPAPTNAPMEEEEMTDFMPVVGPAGTFTFSFVVPDRPGEWTYACFQQDGQHFRNGMSGAITVLPRAA